MESRDLMQTDTTGIGASEGEGPAPDGPVTRGTRPLSNFDQLHDLWGPAYYRADFGLADWWEN